MADIERVVETLEPGGDRLPLGMAEISVASSSRDDQVVEPFAGSSFYANRSGSTVDRADGAEHNPRVGLLAQKPPDRNGDVARRERGGCDLIQQRLEEVVLVRSITTTSASACLSLRAAEIPANPPPMMTTCGRAPLGIDGTDLRGSMNGSTLTHFTFRGALAAIRLTRRRAAPGTPLGSWRKNASVV